VLGGLKKRMRVLKTTMAESTSTLKDLGIIINLVPNVFDVFWVLSFFPFPLPPFLKSEEENEARA